MNQTKERRGIVGGTMRYELTRNRTIQKVYGEIWFKAFTGLFEPFKVEGDILTGRRRFTSMSFSFFRNIGRFEWELVVGTIDEYYLEIWALFLSGEQFN